MQAFASCRVDVLFFFYYCSLLCCFDCKCTSFFSLHLVCCLRHGPICMNKKSGNKCARPCNVGFYFMPILCGGVKSLFGFVFTVVWPSDSVAPLICCDIMPSLFVSRNTVCFESWHQITTAAILVANGKLAFISDCVFNSNSSSSNQQQWNSVDKFQNKLNWRERKKKETNRNKNHSYNLISLAQGSAMFEDDTWIGVIDAFYLLPLRIPSLRMIAPHI